MCTLASVDRVVQNVTGMDGSSVSSFFAGRPAGDDSPKSTHPSLHQTIAMSALTGLQLQRLNELLLSAFDAASLAQFLQFKLDITLEHEFGGAGTPLKNSVFAVVAGLEQRGKLTDFIEGVRVEFPARTDIQAEFPSLRQAALGISRPAPVAPTTAGGGMTDVKGITIGIITALPKELAAMKAALVDCRDYNVPGAGAGRRYFLGSIPSLHGGVHQIVLALADMGNNIATARATLLLEHFPSVDALIMVGIAGGMPAPNKSEDHVRLGDVVVSNKKGVVQYDMVKLTEVRACPITPSARLIEADRLLEAGEYESKRPWDTHIEAVLKHRGWKRPAQLTDKLFDSADPAMVLTHPKDRKRQPKLSRVFRGVVASANELLKDPVKRDSLRDKFGARAAEMEGSGIADASWNLEKGYLVVRGICDYCDSHKNDDWQEYAAAVAAGYTRALLESVPVANPQ